MNPDEYKNMFEVEQTHWWFKGKRATIRTMIEREILSKNRGSLPLDCLDVGCGTGANLQLLADYGTALGIDYNENAITYARQRGLENVRQASAYDLPLDDKRFDLITFFDVLYHRGITNDVLALKQAYESLKPGGFVLITDSAHNWLKSTHDQAVWARQRYSKAELASRVTEAGFDVIRLSYTNMSLFLPLATVRLIQRLLPAKQAHSNVHQSSMLANKLFGFCLNTEAKLLRHINLPVGSSVLCLGQKRK